MNLEANNSKWCGTTLTSEQLQYEKEHVATFHSQLTPLDYKTTLPLCIFILANNENKTAISENEVLHAIDKLNLAFAPIKISFEACNILYLKNDYLFNFNKSKEKELLKFVSNNTINLFFVNDLSLDLTSNACGYTFYPVQNTDAIILRGGCCIGNTSSLIHEMGHFLGLYHTHEKVFGEEKSDGSNCFKSGDLICDTPADPGLNADLVNNNCEYTAKKTSRKNEFHPDLSNFMAYGRNECRNNFTKDQYNKMAEVFCNFKTHIKQLNISYFVSDSLIFPNQGIKLKVKTKAACRWPNGDSANSVILHPIKDTIVRCKTFPLGIGVIEKNFKVKVVSDSPIQFPSSVCKGDSAVIKITNSSLNIEYQLHSNNKIIHKKIGTGTELVFKTPINKNKSEFKVVLKNPLNQRKFTLSQKILISIAQLPKHINRLKIYNQGKNKGLCTISNTPVNSSFTLFYQNKAISNTVNTDSSNTVNIPFTLNTKDLASIDIQIKTPCFSKKYKNAFYFKEE